MRLTNGSARNIALWMIAKDKGVPQAAVNLMAGAKIDAVLKELGGLGFYLGVDPSNPAAQKMLQSKAIVAEPSAKE